MEVVAHRDHIFDAGELAADDGPDITLSVGDYRRPRVAGHLVASERDRAELLAVQVFRGEHDVDAVELHAGSAVDAGEPLTAALAARSAAAWR
jgi:hypothetical protein